MRSTVRYRPCDKRAGRQYREPAVRGRRPHAAQLAGQAHAHETSSARRSFVICAPSRRRQLQRSPSGCVCVRACEARGRAWCVRTHVRTAIRDVCSFLTHEHGHAQRCRVLCRGTTAAALRRRRGTPCSFGPSTLPCYGQKVLAHWPRQSTRPRRRRFPAGPLRPGLAHYLRPGPRQALGLPASRDGGGGDDRRAAGECLCAHAGPGGRLGRLRARDEPDVAERKLASASPRSVAHDRPPTTRLAAQDECCVPGQSCAAGLWKRGVLCDRTGSALNK